MSLYILQFQQSGFFSKYILSLWSVINLEELNSWHLQTLRNDKSNVAGLCCKLCPFGVGVQYHNAQKKEGG